VSAHPIRIGTAAWAIPRQHAESFPEGGSALERYARVLGAAEINTTFHRRHRVSTFERWRESVPPDFRFAVKLPRAITHEGALRDPSALLRDFFDDVRGLGERLGPVLVQLPPKLEFDALKVATFFAAMRALHSGPVVCEPRHASWLTPMADALLSSFLIARTAADPVRPPGVDLPGGARALSYFRMHGSPRRYYSACGPERLPRLVAQLREAARRGPVWCIFDNTASGAAAADALLTQRLING
jgi:uncharacterized protein YecE (DUF72 family)